MLIPLASILLSGCGSESNYEMYTKMTPTEMRQDMCNEVKTVKALRLSITYHKNRLKDINRILKKGYEVCEECIRQERNTFKDGFIRNLLGHPVIYGEEIVNTERKIKSLMKERVNMRKLVPRLERRLKLEYNECEKTLNELNINTPTDRLRREFDEYGCALDLPPIIENTEYYEFQAKKMADLNEWNRVCNAEEGDVASKVHKKQWREVHY